MMGGQIVVNSKEGEGSEFIVDLPCKIADKAVEYTTITELKGLRALVAGYLSVGMFDVKGDRHASGLDQLWQGGGHQNERGF